MRKFGLSVLALASLLLVAAFVMATHPGLLRPWTGRAEPVALGAPFSLTDQNGKSFSSTQLRGVPFAIFFGFTHCPDECPTTLADLTQALKLMGPDADRLKVLFVTFDPARDTVPVMAAWLKNFDPRIVGLTGSAAALDALAKSYGVFFKAKAPDKSGNYDFTHTSTTYLMDDQGRFVGEISPDDTPKAMLPKLETLVHSGAS